MTTAVLLVGHGSRVAAGNEEIEKFTNIWQARNPSWKIELCFIEFEPITVDMGLANATHGADRVIVVPLILNAAGHVKMEIPYHIEKARKQYPNVEFVYARHLGANDKLLAILKRNLRKAMMELDMPDPKTTGVILLGRGSSDRVANGENAKLSRYLFEESQHELVDPAFTGISFPRLETAVQRQVKLGMMQIAVLPYYLFSGTLMERIKKQVVRLQSQYPQISFSLASYFGFEDEIFELLDERIVQAKEIIKGEPQPVMMECDGCAYREEAEAEHQHHHHHDHGDEQDQSYEHSHEEAVT
ncbi:MAG: sirohydrochlorin chelatase [bacterium]|nr:sirohydrochlorin chelatase [bacterium]